VLRNCLQKTADLGSAFIEMITRSGLAGIFLMSVVFRRIHLRRFMPLLSEQIYFVGVLSLIVVAVSGLFIGMVVALQGYHTLSKFGAEQALGQLIALSVTRELGPVVTALLFAGRAGTALTAEIGLMRSTEQIASMEMMAVDPLWHVISPRLWSGLICMPVLTVLFNLLAVFGGYLVGVVWLGLDAGAFWSNMQSNVDFNLDVVNGLIKSCIFGFISIWIALYQGFYTQPSAIGVGKATTKGVVYSSLAILGIDFILTAMMMEGW
jgi:phospholipid/cholesterol/gamma-HCH transport system permease protein